MSSLFVQNNINKNFCIYKITNKIDNKIYIGKTTQGIKKILVKKN